MKTENAEIIPPPAKARKVMDFTDEIFDEICDRMANGKGLREICTDPEMPNRQTFLRWVEKDTDRQARYQRAREALMDWYSEEILNIAWDDTKDTLKGKDGEPKCNHEWINRSRLKVDTLKFLMAKLHPKKYGDRLPEMLPPSSPVAGELAGRPIFPCWTTVYSILGTDGSPLHPDSPEYHAAIERAARAARAEGKSHVKIGVDLKPYLDEQTRPSPAQLTFQPDPLPGNLSDDDWTLLQEVLNLIRRTIPTDDDSPPATIFGILRQALLLHFREIEVAEPATPEVRQ